MINERINNYQCIEARYLNETKDKAIIKVLIDKNEGFYNRFDPKKTSIDDNILDYITNEAYNIPFKYKIVIEFYSDDLSEEEKNKINKIIRNYYIMKISNKDSIIKINLIKALFFMLFGVLMVIYSFLGGNFLGGIYQEVISVISWVLLWEGIDILALSNSSEKIEKKNFKQLYYSEIIFSDKLELKD